MVFTTIDQSLVPTTQSNILDNGGFEVWQRGTSFTNPAHFAYTTDRWRANFGSVPPSYTVTRESTIVDVGSIYSAKVAITATSTPDDTRFFEQNMENATIYRNQTLTLSIRVNTTSSHIRIGIGDDSTYTPSATHPGDGQWHTLTVTKTISGTTNGLSASVGFDVNTNVTNGTIIYVDNAVLTFGPNAATFVPLNSMIDLARCQRFFEAFGAGAPPLGLPIYNNSANTAAFADGIIMYKVTKRVNPAVTITMTQVVLSLIPPGGGSPVTDTGAWSGVNDSGDLGCLAVQFQRSGAVASARVGSFQFTFTASADL